MEACISSSLMPEGLLREHIMLIAVLNSRVGSEIGNYCINFCFCVQSLTIFYIVGGVIGVSFEYENRVKSHSNDGVEAIQSQ